MTSDIIIRKAKPADLDMISKLDLQLFQSDSRFDCNLDLCWPKKKNGIKNLNKMINGHNSIVFVAFRDNQIIGYASGSLSKFEKWRKKMRAEMHNIYIMEQYRSSGVGKSLIETFTFWAKSKGAEYVTVHVYFDNERARNFYEKNGFISQSLGLEKLI